MVDPTRRNGRQPARGSSQATTAREDEAGVGGCVKVLGGCALWDAGVEVPLPLGSRRLLAVLALWRRTMARCELAGTLWPRSSDDHAQSSLRSALARLFAATPRRMVRTTFQDVALVGELRVDLAEAEELARQVMDPATPTPPAPALPATVAVFSQELLPGWYDDWVTLEAERWRQLRLHTLERLAERLMSEGALPEASLAAMAAVNGDPLRESSRAALIRVHLAEGNQSEALREFNRYRTQLRDALRLEPTAALKRLFEPGRIPDGGCRAPARAPSVPYRAGPGSSE